MKFLRTNTNYESMTNQQLLKIAREKSMLVSATDNNRLMVVRGVADDRQGHADRQEFIQRLQALDNQHRGYRTEIVAILSLAISLISIYLATRS